MEGSRAECVLSPSKPSHWSRSPMCMPSPKVASSARCLARSVSAWMPCQTDSKSKSSRPFSSSTDLSISFSSASMFLLASASSASRLWSVSSSCLNCASQSWSSSSTMRSLPLAEACMGCWTFCGAYDGIMPMPPMPMPMPMPMPKFCMGRWYPIWAWAEAAGLAVRSLWFICWNLANSAGLNPAGRCSCIEGPICGACMPGSNSAAHAGEPLCCARSNSLRICSMANGEAGPGPWGSCAFCCMNSFIICATISSCASSRCSRLWHLRRPGAPSAGCACLPACRRALARPGGLSAATCHPGRAW
ncbi:hypothetical protein B5807_00917 [Epicoccum nigrum]|uniref:Uncharacterized protein n=1 Tax=Epicoccum nigrum TaxID=105696 RepID=A0A1Y2MFC9_EPING|nr:hypothetical protein B5807_00917 [Epicoccum nigrum]